MKHKKAVGRERIFYGLFRTALYSWWVANNFATCLQWKGQNFAHSSSSAEAFAAADDAAIVNAFVTVLFTLGCLDV